MLLQKTVTRWPGHLALSNTGVSRLLKLAGQRKGAQQAGLPDGTQRYIQRAIFERHSLEGGTHFPLEQH